jgi:hypothetical protein
MEDFTYPWDPSIQEILSLFRTLINKAEQTLDLPMHGAARALLLVKLSTVLVVGLFEEEEEGIGIASDEGEDPATPGSLKGNRARWHFGDPFRGYVLLGPPSRKPRDRNDFPVYV